MPTQPDGNTRVWGVNSFMCLPAHGGEFSEDMARTARYRMPSVQNLKTSLSSGPWLSVVDYDAVASVPGASQKGTGSFARPDGKMAPGHRVMENASALGRMFKELSGSCSIGEGPVETLHVEAFRYTEMYALEYGSARNSSRLPCRRPLRSLFPEGYPKTSGEPARLLNRAVSEKFAPNHLAMEAYCLLYLRVRFSAGIIRARVSSATTVLPNLHRA